MVFRLDFLLPRPTPSATDLALGRGLPNTTPLAELSPDCCDQRGRPCDAWSCAVLALDASRLAALHLQLPTPTTAQFSPPDRGLGGTLSWDSQLRSHPIDHSRALNAHAIANPPPIPVPQRPHTRAPCQPPLLAPRHRVSSVPSRVASSFIMSAVSMLSHSSNTLAQLPVSVWSAKCTTG